MALAIRHGERPRQEDVVQERGPAAASSLWEIATKCWVNEPKLRPSASEVLERVRDLAPGTRSRFRESNHERGREDDSDGVKGKGSWLESSGLVDR